MIGLFLFVAVIFGALLFPMLAPWLLPAAAIGGIWLLSAQYTSRTTRKEDVDENHHGW